MRTTGSALPWRTTRRSLLAATATSGTTLTALAGCLDRSGGDGSDGSDETDAANSTGDENDTDDSAARSTVSPSLPMDITTVDGPGSEAGAMTVPPTEGIMLLNFTRVHCPTSEGLHSTIGTARERLADEPQQDSSGDELDYTVGPDGTVTVFSVIDTTYGASPSPAELGEWWAAHDGNWTIGMDEEGTLQDVYEVRGTPTTIVIDAEGESHWRDEGGTTTANFVTGVTEALETLDGGGTTTATDTNETSG
ncbi:TlpA family protein disulfide reductase [Natrialba asiatica]|uniref:Alkyl hydroperoxide reductase/ thiol specific antioxidant/ Mal allergen n=1 Tax=Natrialba asiatica (strain ATCC 700177 / DSM 12278 / JCM 9576 / FERM P-10747 / NBRC 102637 / 172P1) TaxID=29540 RepID=M0APA0_NATA1|nr:hypothetical protein [Natrialba asiatica]ELZ00152.1 alkyl hydroperoxide reductase/ thiol specific antioxidant/ Mal allergen [Natrialba asiatica DSM 12278]